MPEFTVSEWFIGLWSGVIWFIGFQVGWWRSEKWNKKHA